MLTLILGGARSGKSDLALRLAAASGRDVLFVATMRPGDDPELRARIDAHRAARPHAWRTVEEPLDVAAALAAHARDGAFVVVDCLTLAVANLLLDSFGTPDALPPHEAAAAVSDARERARTLAAWCAAFAGEVAVVSNEVGQGVVPAYPLGRVFRDALGAANRIVAARADRVYHLVAGLTLELKALGAVPVESLGEAPAP